MQSVGVALAGIFDRPYATVWWVRLQLLNVPIDDGRYAAGTGTLASYLTIRGSEPFQIN